MSDVIKKAAEAFNKRDHEGLTKLFGGHLAKNVASTVHSAGETTFHVTDAVTEGNEVRFKYVAKGGGSETAGAGVATVQNGQIVGIRTGDDVSLTGTWLGSAQGISVTLQLVQTGNNVTGTASAFGSSFPVNGTVNYPNVSLNGNMNGVAVTYVGPYNPPPNTITGTLTAMGSSIQVPINRQ